MASNRWTNPYIALAASKPDYILQAAQGVLSDEQLDLLHARMAGFKECFVEAGSGSGGHLLAQAGRNAAGFYVGFELRYKRAFDTGRKAEKSGVKNLLVVRGQNSEMFRVFEPQSLRGIFVNFPDPWDRRRWHKHRMLNADFLNQAYQLLHPSGFISYKTDHSGYFDATVGLLHETGLFTIEKLTHDLYHSEFLADNLPSEFEKLFVSKGLPINFLVARK